MLIFTGIGRPASYLPLVFFLAFTPFAWGQSQGVSGIDLQSISHILDWVSYEYANNLQFNLDNRRQNPRETWEQIWKVQADGNRGAQIQAHFYPKLEGFLAGDPASRSASLAASAKIQAFNNLYEQVKTAFEINQKFGGTLGAYGNSNRQRALFEFLYNSMVALDAGDFLYNLNRFQEEYGIKTVKDEQKIDSDFSKFDRVFSMVLVVMRATLVSEGARQKGWIESNEGLAAVDRLATQILHASVLQANTAFARANNLGLATADFEWQQMLKVFQGVSLVFEPLVQEKVIRTLEKKLQGWGRYQKKGFLYAITNEYKGTLFFLSAATAAILASSFYEHPVEFTKFAAGVLAGFIVFRKLPDLLDGEFWKFENRVYFDYLQRLKIAKGFLDELANGVLPDIANNSSGKKPGEVNLGSASAAHQSAAGQPQAKIRHTLPVSGLRKIRHTVPVSSLQSRNFLKCFQLGL